MEREWKDPAGPSGPARRHSGPPGVARSAVALACLATLFLAVPGPARADERPVKPLLVASAAGIGDPVPWASPRGEQIISFIRLGTAGGRTVGVRARSNGLGFRAFETLSNAAGTTSPELAFGPDGTAIALWGTDEAGTVAGQAIRPPGGPFGEPAQAGPCVGPLSLASSSRGEVLAACRAESDLGTPHSGWLGAAVLPGPVSFTGQLTPPTDDPLFEPFTAWGADGTSVAGFSYGTPGASEVAIEARVSGPEASFVEEELIGPVAPPGELEAVGATVLPNGTVAITATAEGGSILFTREPGAGQEFSGTALPESSISPPYADRFGRLHFVVSSPTGPGDSPAWVRVRDLDGSVGDPIPIPLTGEEATIVEGGFQVRPGGAEYVVFRNTEGFFMTLRRPGPTAFSPPRRVAITHPSDSVGSLALTPTGDLLLAWSRQSDAGVEQLWLGGVDQGNRPEITRISVPEVVVRGRTARLSARVTDPMGIDRVVWRLEGGRRAVGPQVRLRFNQPGSKRVTVTAIDRAGNRSSRTRSVSVIETRGR